MRVVVAPDKFKGSLTAAQAAERMAAGVGRAVPGAEVLAIPMADGGEGTVAAALAAGWTAVSRVVTGPLGEPITAVYAVDAVDGGTAVVELASASGLASSAIEPVAALAATSRGTGELVADALDAGCERVLLGVGGSAGTDGGAGLLAALGARFLDARGDVLPDGGGALERLAQVDLTGLHPRLAEVAIVLASDVDNPLLGPNGAAAVYGPQKGADGPAVAALERGLARLVAVLEVTAGASVVAAAPGAGAAGGTGFGAMLLGARQRVGVDVVVELTGLTGAVAGADVVLTGEGSLDLQSLHGKTPVGVARVAAAAGVPVLAVAGRVTLPAAEVARAGFAAAAALTDLEPDLERCIADAGPLLERVTETLLAEHLSGTRHRAGASEDSRNGVRDTGL